jgi:hypothetical protein
VYVLSHRSRIPQVERRLSNGSPHLSLVNVFPIPGVDPSLPLTGGPVRLRPSPAHGLGWPSAHQLLPRATAIDRSSLTTCPIHVRRQWPLTRAPSFAPTSTAPARAGGHHGPTAAGAPRQGAAGNGTSASPLNVDQSGLMLQRPPASGKRLDPEQPQATAKRSKRSGALRPGRPVAAWTWCLNQAEGFVIIGGWSTDRTRNQQLQAV